MSILDVTPYFKDGPVCCAILWGGGAAASLPVNKRVQGRRVLLPARYERCREGEKTLERKVRQTRERRGAGYPR